MRERERKRELEGRNRTSGGSRSHCSQANHRRRQMAARRVANARLGEVTRIRRVLLGASPGRSFQLWYFTKFWYLILELLFMILTLVSLNATRCRIGFPVPSLFSFSLIRLPSFREPVYESLKRGGQKCAGGNSRVQQHSVQLLLQRFLMKGFLMVLADNC